MIETLEDMKKIILKRQNLEEWVDEEFRFFRDAVIGCFVKVAFKKTYKLAEIVDAQEFETTKEIPAYTKRSENGEDRRIRPPEIVSGG